MNMLGSEKESRCESVKMNYICDKLAEGAVNTTRE